MHSTIKSLEIRLILISIRQMEKNLVQGEEESMTLEKSLNLCQIGRCTWINQANFIPTGDRNKIKSTEEKQFIAFF